MTKVIALHSNRGGVGKTLVATNLAFAYSKLGNDVCLIDLDFRAPSLFTTLRLSPRVWINDFLDNQGNIWDTLIDVKQKYDTNGKLLVGLADPSINSIKNMAWKSKKWEMNAFRKLLWLKKELTDKAVDYLILDTSPGILYSSVNAVACSDMIIIVTTANDVDAIEIQKTIKELYTAFEKPTFIFMNKTVSMFQWDEKQRHTLIEKFSSIFNVPILAVVPCYCDLLTSERETIHVLENPEHPFSKAIYNVAKKTSEMTDV